MHKIDDLEEEEESMVKTVTEASKEDSDLGLCLEILQTTDGPDLLLLFVSLIVTRDQKRKEEAQFGWVPSSVGRRPRLGWIWFKLG